MRRFLPLAGIAALATPLLAHEADNFKLSASDGVDGDCFGAAVAIDGTVAVVAAPMADGIGADSGAIYIFTFDGMLWNETVKLTASNAAAGDLFGSAVAIKGDRIIVGAPGANSGDGCAYAFSFDGLNWGEDSVLAPAGLAAAAGFGSSLDVDGDSAVVGAPNAGAAYVFTDGMAGWAQEDALSAAGSVVGDLFGAGATINGDRIAIGAPNGTGVAPATGVVHVFNRSGSSWSEGQSLALPFGEAGDLYGAAVDMDGGQEIIIGIPGLDSGGTDAGGAQRWARDGANWVIVQSFPGRDLGDRMGESVSINGRTSSLGVAGDDDEALEGGTTYRFLKNSITPLEVYVASDNEADDAFGSSVGVGAVWAINGAPGHDANLGAAYIHSTVQAIVLDLDGSGVNPDILETTAGPVIGQPWDLEIDLTLFPESERTMLVLKKVPLAVPLMTPFGEVFFSLEAPTLLANVALGDHSIPVPNNVALLDNEGTIQGIVFGAAIDGFPILALTNGQTITIGTTDFPVNEEDDCHDTFVRASR